MNPIVRPLLVALSFALAASTALAADQKPPKSNAPPPPGINDPGVSTPAAPQGPAAANTVPAAAQDPLAPLAKPDSRLVRDKASRDVEANSARMASSQVTRRQQGDDTIEEYSDKGHVWMIKIAQPNGPTQTFMDPDGGGRLLSDPNQGPVKPVYYTLYEWK
ncbi:MAG: DUF2782 domain-containing protein [Dokdonella sp.]